MHGGLGDRFGLHSILCCLTAITGASWSIGQRPPFESAGLGKQPSCAAHCGHPSGAAMVKRRH